MQIYTEVSNYLIVTTTNEKVCIAVHLVAPATSSHAFYHKSVK